MKFTQPEYSVLTFDSLILFVNFWSFALHLLTMTEQSFKKCIHQNSGIIPGQQMAYFESQKYMKLIYENGVRQSNKLSHFYQVVRLFTQFYLNLKGTVTERTFGHDEAQN